jgi:hypothetical protein
MAIRSKRYVSDYQREGEQLVAVCGGCQRTSILSYVELNRRAMHMRTLEELPRFLRCRNCKKKVAVVRLATSFGRPPANRH